MKNIPNVKLGLIAVSRDCFPIALSERRRAAIAAAYGGELYECPVTVENELDMLKAVADVNGHDCNAPIKGLYELGVEVEENSELDLLVSYKEHANDPRIPAVCAEMAEEMGRGRFYSELNERMAQFELTVLDWAENHRTTGGAGSMWPSRTSAGPPSPANLGSSPAMSTPGWLPGESPWPARWTFTARCPSTLGSAPAAH